jgi:putative ABC transport system permease protein
MIVREAIRNLLTSKLRLILTSLAIVLGVGFVVGSFVLGDTINAAFDGVFTTANKGVTVQVRGNTIVAETDRQPVPASTLPAIRAVEGVRAVDGSVSGTAQIIGRNGKPAGLQGPPALGFSWSDDAMLNPLRVTAGSPPRRADDVVIDRTTARSQKFVVGADIRIITASGSARYRLAGIVTFGDQNNLAGATIAAFTPATAHRVLDSLDRFATVSVSGKAGVAANALATRIQAVLPEGYEAITGAAAARETSDQFKRFVDIFRNFLLAFAAIALFVGSFIILNAFKITVAQRTRQLGLLRAVGASPSQVVRAVLLEASAIGIVASVIGTLFGIAFAALLRLGFNAAGAALPATSLHIAPRSIIVGMAVGIVVTLVAAFIPAWRASRVPPIAAMRDTPLTGSPRARRAVSVGLTAVGITLVLVGLVAPLSGLSRRFVLIGVGAILLFLGSAMLTQYVARPLANILGAPMAHTGLAGRLGRGNAMRNPSRTAQTAAALTIGVALVTGVTIFAASLKATFVGVIDSRITADLIILTPTQQPMATAVAAALTETPNIGSVTAWRNGQFKDSAGETQSLDGVDPVSFVQMYNAGVTAGSIASLSQPGTIAVQEDYATSHELALGASLPALFAKSGPTRLRVAAIFTDDTFGRFFVSHSEYARNFTGRQDQVVLVRAPAGGSAEASKALASARLTDFPNVDIRTKAEYRDFVGSQITGFLRLFYVLLAMAVIIAIFGIVLTLALSVFERTREIGLLRAVGLSRRSVRAMIRWEAIIVALIGALVGLILGVFLGVVSVSAIPEFKALSIPWASMVVFLLAAAIFGVLAAILPARRAARLNVLQAIQNE